MTLLKFIDHESFLIHGKNANLLVLHHLIRYKFLVLLHPNAFEHLCIPNLNRSNHNYKVLIALHLGLHVEKDKPHTACNHAKKLKNMDRG